MPLGNDLLTGLTMKEGLKEGYLWYDCDIAPELVTCHEMSQPPPWP